MVIVFKVRSIKLNTKQLIYAVFIIAFLIVGPLFTSLLQTTSSGFASCSVAPEKIYSKDLNPNSWYASWNDSTNSDVYGYGIALAPNDNIYIVGETSTNNKDGFIARYSSNGIQIANDTWLTNPNAESAWGMVMNGSDIYIAGFSEVSSDEISLVRYNSTLSREMNVTWLKSGATYCRAYDVTTDGTYLYIAGFSNNGSDSDGLILKMDQNGAEVWNVTYAVGGSNDIFRAITLSGGILYVAGDRATATTNGLLALYNATDGQSIWNVTWSLGMWTYGYGVGVDSSGGMYVSGTSTGAVSALYLRKFRPTYSTAWTKIYSTGDSSNGFRLAIDGSNNIYVTGSVTLGAIPHALILKYDVSGNIIGTTTWTSPTALNDVMGRDITLDAAGNVYIVGYMDDSQTGKRKALILMNAAGSPGDTPIPGFELMFTLISIFGLGTLLLLRKKSL